MPGPDGGAGCVRAAQGLGGRPEQGVQVEVGALYAASLAAAVPLRGRRADEVAVGLVQAAATWLPLPSPEPTVEAGPDRKRWPHPSSSALAWRIMAV
ncbi:hypothetical protein ACIA6D_02005 [Streptomyces cacaoi]|uniref:hypothetical protein n=1 Tax=Streptomyces cacaoi TaxID=1898 RepID=UPI003747FEA1